MRRLLLSDGETEQHFKIHRMIHTEEKQYLCEQCAYQTYNKYNLVSHERTHFGVKPFACKQCLYTTVFKRYLKAHERIHSGVKPFACSQCSYSTAVRKENLKRHERTHL